MNVPNILTVSRIFLACAFVFFLTRDGVLSMALASICFSLASFTDFFDGYYAKKHNLVSDFGKIMDPIADKFLILAAFFVFARMDIVAVWMFGIIAAREVAVTVARLMAMRRGKVLAAEKAGKWKTVSQMAAIFIILASLMFREAGVKAWWLERSWHVGIYALMLGVVGLTLFSGVSYFWNNRQVFRPAAG